MKESTDADVDVSECENVLDANWNERKHLIDEEFDLRLEIQKLLVKGDTNLDPVLERERTNQAALRRNQEEYEAAVRRWAAELSRKQN
jgi:hypothetical protein